MNVLCIFWLKIPQIFCKSVGCYTETKRGILSFLEGGNINVIHFILIIFIHPSILPMESKLTRLRAQGRPQAHCLRILTPPSTTRAERIPKSTWLIDEFYIKYVHVDLSLSLSNEITPTTT